MLRLARLTSAIALTTSMLCVLGPSSAQGPKLDKKPPAKADGGQTTVVAEGVGKDEKEALKAAFRDAVGRVVGTLVDAETLVKNDEVISERILEFSGGFVKTFEQLKSEKTAEGLVKVQIRATVERLQLTTRLTDAKVAVREVRGEDLLAERLTKDEARKNATALLAKLYADLPKVLKAEARGKPQLNDSRDSVYVDVTVSVDVKSYMAFSKKAVALLDKLALSRQAVIIAGVAPVGKASAGGGMRYKQAEFSSLPKLGPGTPSGYAIWLLTSIDKSGGQMQWTLYWVEADVAESLKPVSGEARLQINLTDEDGKSVAQDTTTLFKTNTQENLPLLRRAGESDASFPPGHWAGWSFTPREYRVDKEPRATVTLFIAPMVTHLDAHRAGDYTGAATVRKKIKLSDDELKRFKQVTTEVEFHPADFEPGRRKK